MPKFKPAASDVRTVREVATLTAKRNGMRGQRAYIEVGLRYSFMPGRSAEPSANVYRVTDDHEGWLGTDLHDYGDWLRDFVKGFDLDERGMAEIDFYVSALATDEYGGREPCGNIQAIFDRDGLKQIDADTKVGIWLRDVGMVDAA